MEIERKFLIEEIPFELSAFNSKIISQAYISTDPVIRIRKIDDSYFLTVKSEGHMKRSEFELEISEEQFKRLALKVETEVLTKTRYYVPLNDGLSAEIDVYEGGLEGLLTAEVEFECENDALEFEPPLWFGRDVTYDKRYKNSWLATFGYCK